MKPIQILLSLFTLAASSFLQKLPKTTSPQNGISYYISPYGNDSNSGTSPQFPWKTALHASQVNFSSNDEVLFLSGAVHNLTSGGLTISSTTGPITITTYGGSGSPATLVVEDSVVSAITILNTGGIEIFNLNVNGTFPTNIENIETSGIYVYSNINGTFPRFQNIYIHDIFTSGFSNGILINAENCTGFENVLIENVTATGAINGGIETGGPFSFYEIFCLAHSNIVVQNSVAMYNPGNYQLNWKNSGSGIVLSSVDGGLITNCLAHHNGFNNSCNQGGPYGIWTFDSNNITISHCVSHSNSNGFQNRQAWDGGGFDLDGGVSNSSVEYCLSFNNSGPGIFVCQFGGNPRESANNTVKNSVSYNDNLDCSNNGSIVFYTNLANYTNMTILGNTIVSNGTLLHNTVPLDQIQIYNNALIQLGNSPILNLTNLNNTKINWNEYWSANGEIEVIWNGTSYYNLEAFRQGTGLEMTAQGRPTGWQRNVSLNYEAGFFQNCVEWQSEYPSLPNDPFFDIVRQFAGCLGRDEAINS